MLATIKTWAIIAVLCAGPFWSQPAAAQAPAGQATTPPEEGASSGQDADQALSPQETEARDAFKAAVGAAKRGPVIIPLAGQGYLDLPKGYLFVRPAEAIRFMRSLGNTADGRLLGIVLGSGDDVWFATVEFVDSGYIRDDEAKNWNADELLQELKDGTEAANEDRIKRGFPALDVTGWIEKPTYDEATKHLVWSLAAYDRGTDPTDASVNYNTYALGREGYFDVGFVTSSQTIEGDKHHALALLDALTFEAGKRYEDFSSSTDKVAAYGIAALVAGVGAKKLGLIAIIAGVAAKFAKAIIFGVIALGVFVTRLFRRKPPGGVASAIWSLCWSGA